MLDRINICYAERVGNNATRCAPPAGPDPDASLTRGLDKILNNEKIPRVPHSFDDTQLMLQPFVQLRGSIRISPMESFPGQLVQIAVQRIHPGFRRNREARHVVLAEFQLQLALPGNLQCGFDGLRIVLKQVNHLLG